MTYEELLVFRNQVAIMKAVTLLLSNYARSELEHQIVETETYLQKLSESKQVNIHGK